MEIREGNGALAGRPRHMDLRLERGERDAHIGGMRGDAGLARAEDRVDAVEAVDRRAAAAGLALVAGRGRVVEIEAARPLQEIAAGRRHVAQLLRGAGQDRARQQRIALLDQRVIGEIGVRHERADAQAAVRGLLDRLRSGSREMSISRDGRSTSSFIRSIRLVPPAMNFAVGIGRDLPHGVGDVGGARVLEIDHDCPRSACWIAATMLG